MTLIYLHIPKTAGTTLASVFKRMFHDAFFDDNRAKNQGRTQFARLSEEEQRKIALVRGHLNFGYHKRLKGDQQWQYLSMVRNPADRVVSLYRHVQRVETHPLHKAATDPGMTLAEFAASGIDASVDNGQIRALTGFGGDFGDVGQEHLDQALQNVDEWFAVLGVTDLFDASLRLFADAIGWPNAPKYHIRNVAPESQKTAVDAEDVALIESLNAFDVQLYERARERVIEQDKRYRQRRAAAAAEAAEDAQDSDQPPRQ